MDPRQACYAPEGVMIQETDSDDEAEDEPSDYRRRDIFIPPDIGEDAFVYDDEC